MSDTSPFTSVSIPFISSGDGKRIDWVDVGLWSLGVVFATFVRYVAEAAVSLWDLPTIGGLHPIWTAYTLVVVALVIVVMGGFLLGNVDRGGRDE